jgi:anti-anti-sigma factor
LFKTPRSSALQTGVDHRINFQEDDLEIGFKREGTTVIASVHGRIDTVSSLAFQQRIEEVLNENETTIVLDLENLEYLSSSGLRSVLIVAKKAGAAGGKLCCCNMQALVKRVFDVSGFSSMIPVFDSLRDALTRQ